MDTSRSRRTFFSGPCSLGEGSSDFSFTYYILGAGAVVLVIIGVIVWRVRKGSCLNINISGDASLGLNASTGYQSAPAIGYSPAPIAAPQAAVGFGLGLNFGNTGGGRQYNVGGGHYGGGGGHSGGGHHGGVMGNRASKA